MKTYRVLLATAIIAAAVWMIRVVPALRGLSRSSLASPTLKVGPHAIPAGVASANSGANYSLFTCQLVGLNVGSTCYDPYQVRHAYQIDSLIAAGFNGRGKTIVIVDAFQSPNIMQELATYNAFYSLPGLNGLGGPAIPELGTFTQVAPDGLTPFDPTNPDMIGWAEEISLDVLWAHAIAPGANIVLVLAKSDADTDMVSATKYAVDNSLGDVISQSFGENESCMAPSLLAEQHQIFANATAKNITVFASAGDFGSGQPSCDGSTLVKAVSTPASDPLVSAVGGTELHAAGYCFEAVGCNPETNPLPGTYQGEIVWNEPAYGAGGGGFSVINAEPSYQLATIRGGKQLGVPDIAYSAAVLHGLLTYVNIPGVGAAFVLFGGTSAGSPQWAAIVAIADQKAGHNLGFINTALYHIGEVPPQYSASFFDITSGNNSFAGVPGPHAESGWDPASGWGSPSASQLVNYLIEFVSPGDGTVAIAGSKPGGDGNQVAHRKMKPH